MTAGGAAGGGGGASFTTLSTIVVQAGQSQIVVSVLKVRHRPISCQSAAAAQNEVSKKEKRNSKSEKNTWNNLHEDRLDSIIVYFVVICWLSLNGSHLTCSFM